jgi:hypothetical protein
MNRRGTLRHTVDKPIAAFQYFFVRVFRLRLRPFAGINLSSRGSSIARYYTRRFWPSRKPYSPVRR